MNKSKKIPDFSTSEKMLNTNSVAYCENFYQYCKHIATYFDTPLESTELRELRYLIACIRRLLVEKKNDQSNANYYGRYKRLSPKLQVLYDEQKNIRNESI